MRLEPNEVEQFIRDRRHAAQTARDDQAYRESVAFCYDDGVQWLSDGRDSRYGRQVHKLVANLSPDTSSVRVTMNRVQEMIRRSSAATHPVSMELAADAPVGDAGHSAVAGAQAMETAAMAFVDQANYIEDAQDANFNRCLAASWLIGLSVDRSEREIEINGRTRRMPDLKLTTFTNSVTRLTLDPANKHRDLRRHEYVIYSDVWDVDRVRRFLGRDKWESLGIREDDLATVGTLTPIEQKFHSFSFGRLYQDYASCSSSKGVVVHCVHVRDDAGVFGQMYVALETPQGTTVVNADDPSTPFGGIGMPYAVIRGHLRGRSFYGKSDFDLIRDDQDKLNIFGTQIMRILFNSAQRQYIVDDTWFGDRSDRASIRAQFTNQVYGIIHGSPKSMVNGRQPSPPQLMNHGAMPADLMAMLDRANSDIVQSSMRSRGHLGEAKTHTPIQVHDRVMDAAEQVHGVRSEDDMKQHRALLTVALGTIVKGAQQNAPSVLQMLTGAGMSAEDLRVLLAQDPVRPACKLRVLRGSVHYRSVRERQQDAATMVQQQALPPEELRYIAASDLDLPASQMDAQMARYATRAVERVLAGEEYEPEDLGLSGHEFMLRALRRVVMDSRVRDPEARMRAREAIAVHRAMQQAEIAALTGGAVGGAQAGDEDPSAEASLAELVGSL